MNTHPVIVIGAGPTGLSAAYHLGAESLLLEQADSVGGCCRSIEEAGFTFDYAGHIMFSNEPYVHELYRMLLGDNVHWQDREAWIYSQGVHTRYPFQGALHGLPPAVIKECVMGAIEARYGSTKTSSMTSPPATGSTREAHAHFEEFIYKVWGAGIAKHFAIPYNRKLWAVPLHEMETSWLGGRVPLPDLEQMIEGALQPVPRPMGPNARFGYVLRGGFQAMMDGFLPRLEGELMLGARVERILTEERVVVLSDGRRLPWEQLISTMPLPLLVRALGEEAPEPVQAAAKRLRHVSVRCVNLGIGRENLTEKHWIYYPEDTVFHRIFVQGNASPHCNPPGGFGLTCEITYSPLKPLPAEGAALTQRCIEDCRRVGMFGANDPILVANQIDIPYAYVVYDHERAANVATIRSWLGSRDILLAGRYSEWKYYNSDHAFLAGKGAAEEAQVIRKHRRGQWILAERATAAPDAAH
jgi:UDP-galactopyranose mutase